MTIGVWEPGRKETPAPVVELRLLHKFSRIALEQDLEGLKEILDPADQTIGAGLMRLEQSSWTVAEQLDSDEVELLVRFFTRAEMLLPGWEGGKRSPVIWLVKILKSRDAFTPEMRRWIRRNSDNRYLPYGSVL